MASTLAPLPQTISVAAWQEALRCNGGVTSGDLGSGVGPSVDIRRELGDLVMNWLIVSGHQSVAEAFQEEAGVKASVPLSSISARTNIRASLSRGQVSSAISQVEAVAPGSLSGPLLLALRQQQLIELLREGDSKVPEALTFARTHLRHACDDPQQLARMESIMSLLAFGVLPTASNPVAHLLAQSQRTALGDRVNEHVLTAQLAGSESQLARTIKTLAYSQEVLGQFIPNFPRIDCTAPAASASSSNASNHHSPPPPPPILDPARTFEALAQAEAVVARQVAAAAAQQQALRLAEAEVERLTRSRRDEARRAARAAVRAHGAEMERQLLSPHEPPLSDEEEEEEEQQQHGEEEEEEDEDQEMST